MRNRPATLHFVLEERPHHLLDPCGEGSEEVWLPLLGPTAWLVARRVITDARKGYTAQDFEVLAKSLGVGTVVLDRALERLIRFQLMSPDINGNIRVLDPWPPPKRR